MHRALFSFGMCVLGAFGAAIGGLVGHAIGPGWLLVGAFVCGALLVAAGGLLGDRLGWIRRSQRLWATLGGLFGFLLAYMVALATIASPAGPVLATLLIGTGAFFGAMVGHSAHDQA